MRTYIAIHRPAWAIALLGGLLCGPVLCQAETRNVPASSEPSLHPNALALLRSFDVPEDAPYTIGDGDELDVQVANRPELSGHHLVGPDGRITLPYAGPFEIQNLSREDAAHGITAALASYYTSLNVTVRVSKYGSNRILVLGHVAQPGMLYFETAPTLLEALTRSRALPAKTSDTASLPNRCALFRGNDQVVWVDVKSMLDQGTTRPDLRLRRDDVLYVPDEQDDLVTVLGEVQHPGLVKLQSNTTLLDVVAMSGGLTPNSGSAKIEVLRQGGRSSIEVKFADLMNPVKSSEIALQRGDVVYVQKSTAAKFEYIVEKLAPLGTIMLFGSTLAGSFH